MKESPIVFTTDSVTAICARMKTQTRRVVTRVGGVREFYHADKILDIGQYLDLMAARGLLPMLASWYCPYGGPGNRLWVRETWKTGEAGTVQYKADLPESDWPLYGPWKSPRYMPKSAARLRLEITGVKVERLQDITEDDACQEIGGPLLWPGPGTEPYPRAIKEVFAYTWNEINDRRGYAWESNPWVWVINFKLLEVRR